MVDKKVVSKNDSSKKDRDTAMRYIAMVSSIPMEPSSVSVRNIQEKLATAGYDISERTVQRDLVKLSGTAQFPLVNTTENRTNFWSFRKGTTSQWPAMSLDMALGILLVENNLKENMPASIAASIDPLVGQARATLNMLDKGGYKKVMADSLRVLPKGFILQKPEIIPEVLNKIIESLAKKRQLLIEWKGDEARINPLGLVLRGSVLYLVCTFEGSTGTRTPAVHRIKSANMLPNDVILSANFNLDEAIAGGRLNWILDEGKLHNFELEVCSDFISILEETPINDTQQIDYKYDEDGEWVLVKFEALYTMELRQWIMGVSDNVIVNAPAKVRKDIRQLVEQMLENYEG